MKFMNGSKLHHLLFLTLLVGLLSMAFLSVGCGDDDDDDDDTTAPDDDDDDSTDDDDDSVDDDDDDDSTAEEMSFITYNAGLAYGFVPLAEDRRSALFEDVPGEQADFMCMQEVWSAADISDMTDALTDDYPYLYRHDSEADFSTAPVEDEARCDSLDNLYDCVDTNCDISQVEGLLDCVFDNCAGVLATTILASGTDCLECMGGNIDKPFDDIVDICTQPSRPPVSYSGSNGLLLFSKKDFTVTEWTQFDFFLTVRVALHAEVETAMGPMHLYCTHLTAPISVLPYLGDYDSYEAEQYAQIQALLDWVDETSEGEPVVLMGDFNNGPGTGGHEDEFPNNYAALTAGGRVDPYAQQNPDACTYCDNNPLNEDDVTGDGGVIIDHLFFNGFDAFDFSAERIYDDVITVNTDDGEVETRLSDHYGVKVTATPK